MKYVEVRTQSELDNALAQADYPYCVGDGTFTAYGSAQVRAYDSAQVTAYGSAQVRAYGSAQVRAYGSAQVTAYDSAQVTAYDSAQVRAYGSAQVRASDSAQVRAYGSAQVRASGYVAVTKVGLRTKVEGGVQILVPEITTAEEWCDFYGVPVDAESGLITLYKVVGPEFQSVYSPEFRYTPGTIPVAPDWDGGIAECGFGLHFSPSPMHAERFADGLWPNKQRYVACPVRLSDIVVHRNPMYPDKVKAKGCAGPVYEVDGWGRRLEDQSALGAER